MAVVPSASAAFTSACFLRSARAVTRSPLLIASASDAVSPSVPAHADTQLSASSRQTVRMGLYIDQLARAIAQVRHGNAALVEQGQQQIGNRRVILISQVTPAL